jgi:hypothetical protein
MQRLALLWIVAACGGGSGAHPDATKLAGHVLFVQFEGQAVTNGIADDAASNTSQLATAPVTLAPFASGAADRATQIAAVTGDLTRLLAPYSVDVVTTRPAMGSYDMTIVTDDLGTKVSSSFANVASITGAQTCSPATGSTINFVFATVVPSSDHHFVASLTLAMFAGDHGVPFSKVKGDCMCLADATCSDTHAACILGAAAAIDSAHVPCRTEATMDEGAELLQVFGAR